MQKRLYRPTNDRKIAGVCSGVGRYLNIDPTVIRLIWAICALMGFGVLAYIVAALIIPEEPIAIE